MPHPLGSNDIIEFLIYRKFPPTALADLQKRAPPGGTTTVDRLLRHGQMDQYRSQLRVLPQDQLQSLYEDESAKALADLKREEDARFFNQPHAAADFDHWCKAEHWSLDEAIALVMGKAPEIVSWDKIKAFSNISPFVKQYARLRDLAERAKVWQKLFDPVLPVIFLKWAEDNDISMPAELQGNVTKLRGKLVDWKKNYDELRSMYDQHIHDWKGIAEKRKNLLDASYLRIDELQAELAAIKDAPPVSDPAKPQSPIERQSMLKAIYAMAARGYGYDPTQKRSTIVSEIVTDLELTGLPLSEDTIRRYLKEALENLGEWKERSG